MTNIFAQSLGLVNESDYISLSPSLRIEGNILYDQANGARHIIRSSARTLLGDIRRGSSVTVLADHASLQGVTTRRLTEMILFLDSIGGLEVLRSRNASIRHAVMRTGYKLKGISLRTQGRRFPASLAGLVHAVGNTTQPILNMLIIVAVLSFGANMQPEFYLLGNVTFLIALYLSTITHEYAHIMFARKSGVAPVILQRGLRIGVIHTRQSGELELVSSVVGPLSGAFSAMVIALLVSLVPTGQTAAALALLVAIFHLISWLPSYGDGREILKQIKGEHYAKTP